VSERRSKDGHFVVKRVIPDWVAGESSRFDLSDCHTVNAGWSAM
jgi:hypothetical protein